MMYNITYYGVYFCRQYWEYKQYLTRTDIVTFSKEIDLVHKRDCKPL